MKKIQVTIMLLLSFAFSGCSSTFAYNNLDWLIYWYLDDYVELGKSQKQLLDTHIATWHHWHRTKELEKYKTQLLGLRQQLQDGPLDQKQWLEEFAKTRHHWERFRDRVSPELSKLALSLDDEQINALFDALEEENLEQEQELLELDEQERLEKRQERLEEQVKDNIGRLSTEQKAVIAAFSPRFVPTMTMWVEYRRAIQSAAKKLMLNRHQVPDFAVSLEHMIKHPDQFKSAVYIDASYQNQLLFAEMVAQINTTLTDKQKRKLDNKIEDLIEDIDDLIDD